MSFLAEARMYGRFAAGLPSFLRRQLSLDQARAIVRERMENRDANFLRLVERGIFGYVRSPYRPLLQMAGCEMGNIRNMVHTKGLEGTLRALREAGVYVTFEEFKGREPIVRNGREIPVQAEDFDNPYLSRYYQVTSGGSTGAAKRVTIDLEHLFSRAPHQILADDANGLLGVPMALWFDILPGSGMNSILARVCYGSVPQRWFSPVMSRHLRPSFKYWLANQSIVAAGRLMGVPIPWPEWVGLDDAAVVARWMAETLRTHGACVLRTHVSKALRVCLAAREAGIDLTGATVSGGGEPPTEAKVREITRSGARYISNYFFAEAGPVGMGCARPADGNDQHFLKDHLALVQFPREVPGTDVSVDAFYFSTLLATAPKLLLNVEIDDYGLVEQRSCGCPWEAYGFTEHLRHIRSFSKLTGEGVTLIGSEMVHILEDVLPARFGGSPLDYQLLEEEDQTGFTRLSLVISPKVAIADEAAVVQTVLEALGQGSVAADFARAIWSGAKTLRVKRMEPVWTARGKLLPLHLAQRAARPPDAATG